MRATSYADDAPVRSAATCASRRSAWCSRISAVRRAGVVDHRAVAGEDAGRRHPVDLAQRPQVSAQRIGGGVRPAPHVGRDLLEQHVAAEQPSAALAVQRDVAVGVSREHQHPEPLTVQVELVARLDQPRGDGRMHRSPFLGVGRLGRHLGRHPVHLEMLLEPVDVGVLAPRQLGQMRIVCALHHLGRAGQRHQPGRGADVVGVVVGDDDAADGADRPAPPAPPPTSGGSSPSRGRRR